jgi:hypothetical protein
MAGSRLWLQQAEDFVRCGKLAVVEPCSFVVGRGSFLGGRIRSDENILAIHFDARLPLGAVAINTLVTGGTMSPGGIVRILGT